MNIGLSYIAQIRGPLSNALGGWIAVTFNELVAAITAGYSKEHNANDTHGAIHCDSISERGRTVAMGVWIPVQFNATDFSTIGAVTTWTVASTNVARFAYMMVGKTMTVAFFISGTSVAAATATHLTIRIPGGYKSASVSVNALTLLNNGTRASGYSGTLTPAVLAGTTSEFIYLEAAGVNWAVSASNTSVLGEVAFEVA